MTRHVGRRTLLGGAAASAATMPLAPAMAEAAAGARPVPLDRVRLLASPFRDAADANRRYLHRLEPDRLLHNFRVQAGLAPRAPAYGGWEAESLAGHTLGHVLSALSLDRAGSGDVDSERRVALIVAELALCQEAGGDGYVGGLTRDGRNGATEGGRAVFDDLRGGRIDVAPFALNGAWSPLYTLHKLLAGLLDAERWCANERALPVAVGLADYLGGVFDGLDDRAMQRMLACEYGGLNESFAELGARTGRARYLRLAGRLHDRRTLDPLAHGVDDLGGLHANTQIPKIVGLARLHAITGEQTYGVAARTFWRAATAHHCFPIGGCGDQEYFWPGDRGTAYLTEQTCETCASYNMLKLTALLHAATPRAHLFDWYERTLLNHMMAQQNPRTGMLAYMTPLMAGAARQFSSPFDDFWCCVGTGLETHASHGANIASRGSDGALLVNLFVPARIDCGHGVALVIETAYPLDGVVSVRVEIVAKAAPFAIRVRVPAWSRDTAAALNGAPVAATADGDGYLTLRRRWGHGDRIELRLDMRARLEWIAGPGPGRVASVLRGPSVLALDLGPADGAAANDGTGDPDGAPVIVAADDAMALRRLASLPLRPFAPLHERRAALAFPVFTEAERAEEDARRHAAAAARAALLARAVDRIEPGDEASSRAHGLRAANSYAAPYRGRQGRDARDGGFVAFALRRGAGDAPTLIGATFWGGERHRRFRFVVDGVEIARDRLDGADGLRFVVRRYKLPPAIGRGTGEAITVRYEPLDGRSAATLYEVLLLRPDGPVRTAPIAL